MKCRHCGVLLLHTFMDLGFAPPSNAYLTAADLRKPEMYSHSKLRCAINVGWFKPKTMRRPTNCLALITHIFQVLRQVGWIMPNAMHKK